MVVVWVSLKRCCVSRLFSGHLATVHMFPLRIVLCVWSRSGTGSSQSILTKLEGGKVIVCGAYMLPTISQIDHEPANHCQCACITASVRTLFYHSWWGEGITAKSSLSSEEHGHRALQSSSLALKMLIRGKESQNVIRCVAVT